MDYMLLALAGEYMLDTVLLVQHHKAWAYLDVA
jgi:hypothetical protein